jgi:hypothetical protein
MSTKRVIGLTVGFLAAAAAAWAMYQTALATDCGVGTGITCPPDWHRQLLIGGVVVSVVAAFLGGAVVFGALALAVGLGAIAGGLSIDGDARTTMFIVGGASTALAFLLLLLVLRFQARMRRAQNLLENGTKAIGTVVSVDDTGTTVNMNPRVRMTLRIEPLDGSAPFEGSKTGVMSRLDLPFPGRRYPVWFDPEDRTIFAVGTKMDDDASPENKQLFALAAQGNPAAPGAAPSGGAPATDGSPAATAAAPPTVADQLTQLNELRLSGALTEEEFAQQKAKLLES